MTRERHDKSNQPAYRIGSERWDMQPLNACHRDQPVRHGRGTADGDEPSKLFDQGSHINWGNADTGNRRTADRCWKYIVVCGDDFGMNLNIDAGMLELAALGRLSAISCLSLGPTFTTHARRLRDLDVDVGLHLNLTESFGLQDQPAVMPLPTLITRAYISQLDSGWIDEQLARQLDAFEGVLGRAPDYVDGHQHVHQLPGVLPRLLRVLELRYGSDRPWLRHTAPGTQSGVPLRESAKARLIGTLGAGSVERAARSDGWRTNRRMLGVYDFHGGPRRYAQLLHHWLNNARDGDLLMCHPALPGAADKLGAQRAAEFAVLASAELGQWMSRNGVQIARANWPMRSATPETACSVTPDSRDAGNR